MTQAYKDIQYSLSKSNRKTASIYIERDGQISIIVPKELTTEKIERLIENKRYWIYKSLSEWRDLNATKIEREFVNGEGFLYLGRSYILRKVPEQEEPLMLKGGYFCLCLPKNKADNPKDIFKAFYKQKGLEKIAQRIDFYKSRMGVEVKKVRIQELQYRWASCNVGGILNFHWKCMMAPLKIIDYIVVHELAHLIVKDHSLAFWNEVDKILPDYQERKEWLRINGAAMGL